MNRSLRTRLENLAEWLGLYAALFLAIWQLAPVEWLTWALGIGIALLVMIIANAFSGNEERLRSIFRRKAEIEDPSHRLLIKNVPNKKGDQPSKKFLEAIYYLEG